MAHRVLFSLSTRNEVFHKSHNHHKERVMTRFALTLTAVGTLAFVASSASANDRVPGPSHSELAHRSIHRAITHDLAHRIGISHNQHHRLHNNLRHEAVHDRIEHNATHRSTTRYATPTQRVYRTVVPTYYWQATPTYRHVTPTSRYVSPSRGHHRSSYRSHGFSISTRGFSFSFGH